MKDLGRVARKITSTLFVAQSFGLGGLIAGGTIVAIAGEELSGRASLAGMPLAVQFAGTAFAALLVGSIMEKLGRRPGMIVGLIVGAIGSGMAAFAIAMGSFLVFAGSLALFGATQATLNQGRFVAAEVHPPERRGRAIAYVVLGGTVGSVLGPQLVGPAGTLALRAGANELVGGYVAATASVVIAALVVFVFLRPDPREVGREIAKSTPETSGPGASRRDLLEILTTPRAKVAIASMVVGQGVMILIMGMTGLHMQLNDHTLSSVSLVMSAHTFGMFAFSIVTGKLTDRWGRVSVILSGATILILGSVGALLSTAVAPLAVALFGVGVGWNFCFVAGSALLSDELSPQERSRAQGVNDLLVYSVTALVSLGSGVLFAQIGYRGITLIGSLASLVLLAFVGYGARSFRRAQANAVTRR